jgi:hypothetical protein
MTDETQDKRNLLFLIMESQYGLQFGDGSIRKGRRLSDTEIQLLQTALGDSIALDERRREPLDYCTEDNCRRCRTPVAHRTPELFHAGIGRTPGDTPDNPVRNSSDQEAAVLYAQEQMIDESARQWFGEEALQSDGRYFNIERLRRFAHEVHTKLNSPASSKPYNFPLRVSDSMARAFYTAFTQAHEHHGMWESVNAGYKAMLKKVQP